jgi:hypothetical protein
MVAREDCNRQAGAHDQPVHSNRRVAVGLFAGWAAEQVCSPPRKVGQV